MVISKWRFDPSNPYEDAFEEALLETLDSPHVFDMLRRKLMEIQRSPTQAETIDVSGVTVFVTTTPPAHVGDTLVPPLLIAYTVEPKRHLIRRLFVRRNDDVTSSFDDELEEAIANRTKRVTSPQTRVLDPLEDTQIPRNVIVQAVRRALRRAKADS